MFSTKDGSLVSSVDSHGARLARPAGLALAGDSLAVADTGGDIVRQYRYR